MTPAGGGAAPGRGASGGRTERGPCDGASGESDGGIIRANLLVEAGRRWQMRRSNAGSVKSSKIRSAHAGNLKWSKLRSASRATLAARRETRDGGRPPL